MKTTQSLIKDILPEDFCPHYIHLKYNVGARTEPTDAMENGLFFESELLGSARGGKFEMPKNKKGEPYKRELDILENVEYAKSIFKELNIKIDSVQPRVEQYNRAGHLDALGTIDGKPVIIDVKWTGMAKDKFTREYRYNLKTDYEIQARHYQSLGKELDFVFLIFGKSNWFEGIVFPYEQEEVEKHITEYSDVATAKYDNLESYDFNPNFDKCQNCRLKDLCKKKTTKPTLKHYKDFEN